MDKSTKARLLGLDEDVFEKVMWAKKRVHDSLSKTRPGDEASFDELATYFEKVVEYKQVLKIHIEREGFKPNSLVHFTDGTEYRRIERINPDWDGDPYYVYCGDLPHYEGPVEELKALTPENFQEMVNFQPEHYLGVYKALDLHQEPGYENIVFPEGLQEVKGVILELKELGI